VESFLGSLYAERKKAHEHENAAAANEAALAECRQVWVGPTVELLCSSEKSERQGMVLYALPSILAVFPQETPHLLQAIALWSAAKLRREEARERTLRGVDSSVPHATEQRDQESPKITSEGLRGFISVLKTARKMGLIDAKHLEANDDESQASSLNDDDNKPTDASSTEPPSKPLATASMPSMNLSSAQSGFHLPIPSLVRIALGHSDEELRNDALELICLGKKTIESPTYFELDMMKYYLWVNIKASSQSLRQGSIPRIGKFLQRLKDCVYHEQKKKHEQIKRKLPPSEEEGERYAHDTQYTQRASERLALTRVARSVEVLVTDFLKWYQSFISFALYPSGSYQRKSTAVALYREMLNVFGAGTTLRTGLSARLVRGFACARD
jgi:hypothetical protein